MATHLDEPNGEFDDVSQGREQVLRENAGLEGRQGSLTSPTTGPDDTGEDLDDDSNEDLDEPSGRLDTLGGNGAGSARDAASAEADQPDTSE